MAELKLPSLGEGIDKGKVTAILVSVGDTVALEQPLMEVETDKVVVEVPSDVEGTITEILVNVGDEIHEGSIIFNVDFDDEKEAVSNAEVLTPAVNVLEPETVMVAEPKKTKKVTTSTMIEVKLPALGEGIDKGTVISIAVAKGDTVTLEQTLMEVETDKVVVEVPAEYEGGVNKVLVSVGDDIEEGQPIIELHVADEVSKEEVAEIAPLKETVSVPTEQPKEKIVNLPKTEVNSSSNAGPRKGIRTSPLARKMAREIGVDISTMPLPNGRQRISVKDVKNYAKMLNENRTSGGAMQMASAPLPDFSKWGTVHREAMTGIMQATSKNMTTSWNQIPHAWLQEKIDITYLEQQRQNHKNEIKAKGGSLTITGILVKVVAKALEDFPLFNASIDATRNEIIKKDYINIGVAVDTERGLLVPVLKDADKKSMADIAFELGDLANKVKQKKITSEELDGATFTISNLGGIGTTSIFPLVTFPQVAILGVAASKKEAVWMDGQFQPRLLMPLTIGFDHRTINGADAARFLQHLKNLLEDWFMWNL